MKIYMIANIVENNKTIGMRLFDADAKKIQDVPISNIQQVLSNSATANMIQNVKLLNGTLYGTNGKLSRYASIDRMGNPLTKNVPLVVINKIGEDGVGYTVVDHKGTMKKVRTEDVVKYANEFGIANGKVCTQDGLDYISAISGAYEIEKVTQSKVKNNGVGVNISVPTNIADKTQLAKNIKKDVETDINYSDVFLAMTPEQKQVLKDYYTWYTVEIYQKMAKSTRLDLAPGKAEKLAQLRGIKKWKFGGVWDAGFNGASKCELGHSLRYEYYAIPEEEADKLQSRTSDRVSFSRIGSVSKRHIDETVDFKIIFGETCASDFFNIAPEDMKKLVKTREIMSNEIKLMSDILSNNLEKLYANNCRLLYDCLSELGTTGNIVDVFGDKVGLTLVNFIKSNMPFPMSLVIEAGKQIRKDEYKAFKAIFKNNILKDIYNSSSNYDPLAYARKFMNFVANFSIEGKYMYDPYDDEKRRKDVGRYNKETRYERDVLLRDIRIGCRIYANKEVGINIIKQYLYVLENLQSISIKFKNDIESELKELSGYSSSQLENLPEHLLSRKENVDKQEILSFMKTVIDYSERKFRFPGKIELLDKTGTSYNYTSRSEYRNITECYNAMKQLLDTKSSDSIIKEFIKIIKDAYEDDERKNIERAKRQEELRKKQEEEARRIIEERERQQKLQEQEELKKQEGLKRKQEEELKKQEKNTKKDNKENEISDDEIIPTLKKLLENNKSNDYGIIVAKDIINRNEDFSKLSYKQKWRLRETLKELQKTDNKQVDKKEDKKQKYQVFELSEHTDIEKDINDILDKVNNDEEFKKGLNEESSITINVLNTVKKSKKYSTRQLRHINIAQEFLKSWK